jgi:hypothetical protein
MRWKTKALIQNILSILPSGISHEMYYKAQRVCGGLRKVDPMVGIRDGIAIVRRIMGAGKDICDKVFVEIGTGRTVTIPITLWLCGASRIITVDLNPYLKTELIREELDFIRSNQEAVLEMVGDCVARKQFNERFDWIARGRIDIKGFMKESRIDYFAPSDARKLPVWDKTIDYHISNNVLEHVPLEMMSQILSEGRRKLKDDGLMAHRIDFSDHFSHSDPRIPTINFLQYSEEQWLRYSGNRYMYHNRARIDEFEEVMDKVGLRIIDRKLEIDQDAVRLIKSGFKLDKRFAGKSEEVNSTLNCLVVAIKAQHA